MNEASNPMKSLVVFDSQYGNTEKIAKAIAEGLGGQVEVQRVRDVAQGSLSGVGLLVVGSPTHGGRPSEPIQGFLKSIPEAGLKGVRAAAFDTRFKGRFIKMFGFAAGRIGAALEAKGASLAAPPEGFIAEGTEGPLADGELERATEWAKKLR